MDIDFLRNSTEDFSKRTFFCKVGIHRWKNVSDHREIHNNYVCVNCFKRSFSLARSGYAPIRTQWINGKSWKSDEDHVSLPPTSIRKSK